VNKDRFQIYASLAEIVSALAIIISLLYVASEFRRAETLTSRGVDSILFERTAESNAMLVESPDLADVVIAAARDADALSETDRLRYLAYQHIFFDIWEMAWVYHEDGILDEETWGEWDMWFVAEAKRRPDFSWTESRRHFTGQDFLRHVDQSVLGE
jgi:hypothetical protein